MLCSVDAQTLKLGFSFCLLVGVWGWAMLCRGYPTDMDGGFGTGEKRSRERGQMFLFFHPRDIWDFPASAFCTPRTPEPHHTRSVRSRLCGTGRNGVPWVRSEGFNLTALPGIFTVPGSCPLCKKEIPNWNERRSCLPRFPASQLLGIPWEAFPSGPQGSLGPVCFWEGLRKLWEGQGRAARGAWGRQRQLPARRGSLQETSPPRKLGALVWSGLAVKRPCSYCDEKACLGSCCICPSQALTPARREIEAASTAWQLKARKGGWSPNCTLGLICVPDPNRIPDPNAHQRLQEFAFNTSLRENLSDSSPHKRTEFQSVNLWLGSPRQH